VVEEGADLGLALGRGAGSREGFFRTHMQEGVELLVGLCNAV